MKRALILVNPEHRGHYSTGHPERPERIDAILQAVGAARFGLEARQASVVGEESLLWVHDESYLSMLDRAAAGEGCHLDPDTYLAAGSMLAARTAAGAVVEGVRAVLAGEALSAFAIVRPPGHHAERAQAMGFCLLNNVAVAAQSARHSGVARIAIVDFDVHHGNGTQSAFYDDPDVLYSSTHQYPYYPGTGPSSQRGTARARGTTINIPLLASTGDDDFLIAYRDQIGPAIERFGPELILVSAGYDAHKSDPLAGLEVTTQGFRALAELIRGWADRLCGGRTVWALEGGYDLKALGDSVVATLEVLRS